MICTTTLADLATLAYFASLKINENKRRLLGTQKLSSTASENWFSQGAIPILRQQKDWVGGF